MDSVQFFLYLFAELKHKLAPTPEHYLHKTQTHLHRYVDGSTHTPTHTYAHIYASTHTHTHTHIHTQPFYIPTQPGLSIFIYQSIYLSSCVRTYVTCIYISLCVSLLILYLFTHLYLSTYLSWFQLFSSSWFKRPTHCLSVSLSSGSSLGSYGLQWF